MARALLALTLMLTFGCALAHDPEPLRPARPGRWWVLIEGTVQSPKERVLLYDEAAQRVLVDHELQGLTGSPQGLAFDGEWLWISVRQPSGAELYQVDPRTGSRTLRAQLPFSEGLSLDGAGFWTCGVGGLGEGHALLRVSEEYELARRIALPINCLDVAFDGRFLYALGFTLERVDPRTGQRTVLIDAGTLSVSSLALSYDDEALAVVTIANPYTMRRFDRVTGAQVREGPFAVDGWVTAIAPDR